MKRIRPPDEERVCLQKGVKMNSEFADLFGSDSEDDHKPGTTVQPASTGDAQQFLATLLSDYSSMQQQNSSLQKHNAELLKSTTQLTTARDKARKEAKDKTTELDKLKKEQNDSKKKGKKTTQDSSPIVVVYQTLIQEVIAQYHRQETKISQAAAPAPAPTQVVQIIQKNTNPTYNTERAIEWRPAPSLNSAFYFDNNTGDGVTNPSWTEISDAGAITALNSFVLHPGDGTPPNPTLYDGTKPAAGYTIGQHTYSVVVQTRQIQPQPVPSTWQNQMLFDSSFVTFTARFVQNLVDGALAADVTHDDWITGSADIANLASVFSSYAQKFTYNSSQSCLWVKPDYFRLWLRIGKDRGYRHVRIGLHGSSHYSSLSKDPAGYDMGHSRGGVKKWALYAGMSDHVPCDYNGGSGYYRGSGMIGLIWTKPNAGLGAYEIYALGSGSHANTPGSSGQTDAIAIRDQLLFCPLGLAVSNQKM